MALTTTYDIALRIAPLLRQPCSFLRGVSQFSGLAPRSLALPLPAYAWRELIFWPRATYSSVFSVHLMRGASLFSGLAPRSLALPLPRLCVARAYVLASRHVVCRFLRSSYAWCEPIFGPRAP